MYKILVIGCGNIGAGYDLENNHVLTHAKAFHLHPAFELSVYDTNKILAETVSKKYNCNLVENISEGLLSTFDSICICTPTNTHLQFLNEAISSGVKLIICEKPVSYNPDELNGITDIYATAKSKVLVNYFRRFQPAYKELRTFIGSFPETEILTNISIRYQRGFINNCSHAFDLIEYLIEKKISLANVNKHNIVNDHFVNDPTLSLQAMWDDVNFDAVGLTHVQFSHFEIDLFFKLYKVSISEAGNIINVYKAGTGGKNLQPLIKINERGRQNCIQDYMKPVAEEGYNLLNGNASDDNFFTSVQLNQKMLHYLSL